MVNPSSVSQVMETSGTGLLSGIPEINLRRSDGEWEIGRLGGCNSVILLNSVLK